MSHAVYRIFAESGQALYVGCTDRPITRIAEHAKNHPECESPGRIEFTYHATRASAHDVEAAEIRRLRPSLNIRGLWKETRTRELGELRSEVIETLRGMGETSSSDVIAALPHVNPKSISAIMMRLRREGTLEVLGKRGGGFNAGRPAFIVRLAELAAA